jgi:enoyl-CoA hydratase/carnithine racemase
MTLPDAALLVSVENNVGYLTLNRPARLNTLNLALVRQLHEHLSAWEDDPDVLIVVLSGAGDRAFCAGGDIRALYDSYLRGDGEYQRFFEQEYALDHHIHRYRKPLLALMDGLVLGGGMGLAQGASLRVVTERARLGMPEVAIGYFPDVGASFFLPRLPGQVGIYLAVTGQQVNAADAIYTGLADVCIASEKLDELRRRLDSHAWSADPASDLRGLVAALAVYLPPGPVQSMRPVIDDYFGLADMLTIRSTLSTVTNPQWESWAKETAALLDSRSPLAMSVALELMRWGRHRNLEECLAMESSMQRQWFDNGDIIEGIRALLVDKDHYPKWRPASLQAVSTREVQAFLPHLAG